MIKLWRMTYLDPDSREYFMKWFTSEEAAEAAGNQMVAPLKPEKKGEGPEPSPFSWVSLSEVIIPKKGKNITRQELADALNEHATISPLAPPHLH
tara:strand:- start:393 stop:677 length:285 start_codon:yes stop_codon:yes gene_type:complete